MIIIYNWSYQEISVRVFDFMGVKGCKWNSSELLLFLQLQLYGFNVELYSNLSDAQQKPNGVVGISIMIRVSVSKLCIFIICRIKSIIIPTYHLFPRLSFHLFESPFPVSSQFHYHHPYYQQSTVQQTDRIIWTQ